MFLEGLGFANCCLMGSGIKEDDICINIGTGSQVIALSEEDAPYSANFDIKPFFGRHIKAITHIPAGRSFNFIKNNLCKDKNFWKILYKTQKTINDEIFSKFNLNIFKTN